MWLYFYLVFRDWNKYVDSWASAIKYVLVVLVVAVPVAIGNYYIDVFFQWLAHH